MIEIISFDLDGTLTESKEILTEEMAFGLKKLTEVVKVAVISGGTYQRFEWQLLSVWEKVSKEANDRNLILLTVDGSQCYEYLNAEKKWIKVDEIPFSEEIKEKVKRELKKILKSAKKFQIPSRSEIDGDYIEDRGTQVTFSAYGQEASLSKKTSWDPDQNKRKKIVKELEKKLPEVEIFIAGTTSIDILPKGMNKAVGLERLLKRLNINKKNMVFVGDAIFPGGNDYSPYEAGIKTLRVGGPEATAHIIDSFIKKLEEKGA